MDEPSNQLAMIALSEKVMTGRQETLAILSVSIKIPIYLRTDLIIAHKLYGYFKNDHYFTLIYVCMCLG